MCCCCLLAVWTNRWPVFPHCIFLGIYMWWMKHRDVDAALFLLRGDSATAKRTQSRLRKTNEQAIPSKPKLRCVLRTDVVYPDPDVCFLPALTRVIVVLWQVCRLCRWSALFSGRFCCTHHRHHSAGTGTVDSIIQVSRQPPNCYNSV